MPLLQVRDFPQDLYDLLAKKAEEENRSITQQTIYLLKKTLTSDDFKMKLKKRILEEKIEELNLHLPKNAKSPTEIIREERDRCESF